MLCVERVFGGGVTCYLHCLGGFWRYVRAHGVHEPDRSGRARELRHLVVSVNNGA